MDTMDIMQALMTLLICMAYALGIYVLLGTAINFIKYVIYLYTFNGDDDE